MLIACATRAAGDPQRTPTPKTEFQGNDMGRGPSIEGRKNAEDAKRGKIFTKLIREITIAARDGNDPAANARLRMGIAKALSANMSKDTIERAINRGSGADAANMQELRYEGYGPSGVALIIDTMTDNVQRTVADVRHALSKHGGNLGTSGSVAFQFARTGELVFAGLDEQGEDRLLEVAIDAGADDVLNEDDKVVVLTAAENFENVRDALSAAGQEPVRAGVVMRPANRVAVAGDASEQLAELLDQLDDLDDVQEVFHNAILPETSD